MPITRILLAATALFGLLQSSLPAQASAALDPRRVEINEQMTTEMVAMARNAAAKKAFTLSREIANLVIAHYAPDNGAARKLIGQRKLRGEWQKNTRAVLRDDAVRPRQLSSLQGKWGQLKKRAGMLHRSLALALVAEGAKNDQTHPELELALVFIPNDRACHKALGHHGLDDFWGSAEDVTFAQRMRDIRQKASELAQVEHQATELPESVMPIELKRMGIPMYGAKSKRYTYWVSDSFESAANLTTWAERCHDFLAHLLGPKQELVRADSWRWHVVLRTVDERDTFLQKSPSTTGPFTYEQARLFAGIGFALEGGGRASATWHEQNLDSDHAVANTTKRHLLGERNEGLGEGFMHVTTWLLCGSTWTYFADLPKTTTGGENMSRDAKGWLERLQQQIEDGEDQPLRIVPRERIDNFRDKTRLKSWSFMFWLLASHPDKWFPLIDAMSVPDLSPEQVDQEFKKAFKMPIEALEQQWRSWARRGSELGKASGWS